MATENKKEAKAAPGAISRDPDELPVIGVVRISPRAEMRSYTHASGLRIERGKWHKIRRKADLELLRDRREKVGDRKSSCPFDILPDMDAARKFEQEELLEEKRATEGLTVDTALEADGSFSTGANTKALMEENAALKQRLAALEDAKGEDLSAAARQSTVITSADTGGKKKTK